MKRVAGIGAIVAVLVAVGFAFAAPAHAAEVVAEARFLELINNERSNAGLAALAVRDDVVPVARSWTDQMVGQNNISHNPTLTAQMPADWLRIGENVGMGQTSDTLHAAFMASTGHRNNILGDFNQVGIGVSLGNGRMFVTVDFLKSSLPQVSPTVAASSPTGAPAGSTPAGACGPNTNPAATPSPAGATGYWVLGSDGGIFSYGDAAFHGSVPGLGIRSTSVLLAGTPSKQGYWILGADGGIFSFGDAAFHGSVPGLAVRATAIDLRPTRSGSGYWILGADGGIFSFGDARFFGSLPGAGVSTRAVKLIPTPSGNGYWILGADGGIFSFGDASFFGSLPGAGVRNTSISMAATPTGGGYWVLGADGGIFSFGDAGYFGSVPGIGHCTAVNGIQLVATATGQGYYVLSDRGGVYAFGDGPDYGEPEALGVAARDIAVVTR